MNRLNNLAYIINCMTAEDARLSAIQMPASLNDRQRLMRALLNIRKPKPVSEDFLKAQDAELHLQKEDNGVVSFADIANNCLEDGSIMQRLGREANTGEAIITKGYNLLTKYVTHTVGPIIARGIPTRWQEVQLANCYRHSLELANEKNLKSIAFCCISTGVFMFPQRRAAEIALASVEAWLDAHSESSVKTVIFNVFKDSDYAIYKSLC